MRRLDKPTLIAASSVLMSHRRIVPWLAVFGKRTARLPSSFRQRCYLLLAHVCQALSSLAEVHRQFQKPCLQMCMCLFHPNRTSSDVHDSRMTGTTHGVFPLHRNERVG